MRLVTALALVALVTTPALAQPTYFRGGFNSLSRRAGGNTDCRGPACNTEASTMKGRLKDGQNPASLPEAPPENPSLNALSSRTVPPNSDAGAVKHNIGLSAVQPGQVIYTDVVINVNDISPHADPQSTTQKKIKSGKPVKRLAVVVQRISPTEIEVGYLATFTQSKGLPFTDKSYWYPVQPAPQEGELVPLSVITAPGNPPPPAQWISLRRLHSVTDKTVDVTTSFIFSKDSVAHILAAKKA